MTDLRDQLADHAAARPKTRRTDYANFDPVLVDRLVHHGTDGLHIRTPDAAEATRRLAHLGYSDGQIAARLGFTRRAVHRIRQRLDIPAALTPHDNRHTRPHDAPARPKARG